ncbi:MAG TPA: hypothetical protein VK664_09410 [Flavitalea sp.]|nr:hypothetical protein [Flavitalea sp.]
MAAIVPTIPKNIEDQSFLNSGTSKDPPRNNSPIKTSQNKTHFMIVETGSCFKNETAFEVFIGSTIVSSIIYFYSSKGNKSQGLTK